jgi:hypothetical protein
MKAYRIYNAAQALLWQGHARDTIHAAELARSEGVPVSAVDTILNTVADPAPFSTEVDPQALAEAKARAAKDWRERPAPGFPLGRHTSVVGTPEPAPLKQRLRRLAQACVLAKEAYDTQSTVALEHQEVLRKARNAVSAQGAPEDVEVQAYDRYLAAETRKQELDQEYRKAKTAYEAVALDPFAVLLALGGP